MTSNSTTFRIEKKHSFKTYSTFIYFVNILLPVLFIFSLTACSGSSSKSKKSKVEGSYDFVMLDTLDNKLIDGDLFITKQNDTVYKASIDIKTKYKDFYSYGNMKTTNIYMNYEKPTNKVFINMNPTSTDDNVYIMLEFKDNELNGEWSHMSIAGIMGKGNIKATKK